MAGSIINFDALSAEQILGLQYATQAANAPIAAANATLPEGAEPTPLITCKQYLERIVRDTLQSYIAQMMIAKTTLGSQMVLSKPVEVQLQVAEIIGVPDVVNPDLAPLE